MSAMQNTAVVQPNRRKSLKQWVRSMRGQQILVTLVFLFVPLLLLITFTYLPFFKMVQFNFFNMRYIGRRTFVGLQNYIDVFTRDDIFHALTLSLYYMAGSVIQMALALLFATLLSFKTKGSKFFRGALYFPCLICVLVGSIMISSMLAYVLNRFKFPGNALIRNLFKVEDTYYIIWCQDFYGASIGIARTQDFKTFTRVENPFVPFNRNAVLFPRKSNGMFTLLSRPSDSGHTPFGDIFLSQSPDMEFWGRHRHVMGKSGNWWENLKIGGGAAPIETSEGWLLFYHGVTGTCNGYVYSIGGAILDRDEPSRVLHRCSTFLLTPETDYEERGFVPNVCFPCATLQDAATGRIALYYGCADSYVGLAFTTVDDVTDYIKAHDETSCADRELGLR